MNKQILIIYCHPYKNSFNHAELSAIEKNFRNNNIDYEVIDLYKDKFNPIYDTKELSLFHNGQTNDPLVKNI